MADGNHDCAAKQRQQQHIADAKPGERVVLRATLNRLTEAIAKQELTDKLPCDGDAF